jgi:hypothetical protein
MLFGIALVFVLVCIIAFLGVLYLLKGTNRGFPTVPDTYVSITTVPERLNTDWFVNNLIDNIIASPGMQVVLHVPYHSLKGEKYLIPPSVRFLQSDHFSILRCIDLGPITKLKNMLQLPGIEDDAVIIIGDDDIKYREKCFTSLQRAVLKNPSAIVCMCSPSIQGFKGYAFKKRVLKGFGEFVIPAECVFIDDDVVSMYAAYHRIPLVALKYNGSKSWDCSCYDTTAHPPWKELRHSNRSDIRGRCMPPLKEILLQSGAGRRQFSYLLERRYYVDFSDVSSTPLIVPNVHPARSPPVPWDTPTPSPSAPTPPPSIHPPGSVDLVELPRAHPKPRTISNYIFQSFSYSYDTLPDALVNNIHQWKATYPEFKYEYWDDTACEDFMRERVGGCIYRAYCRLKPVAFKSDLWRLCVLFQYGGFYLDIKFGPPKGLSLGDLLHNTSQHGRLLIRDLAASGGGVYNAIMGMPKYDTQVLVAIQKIVYHTETGFYGLTPLSVTGPMMMATVFKDVTPRLVHTKKYATIRDQESGTIVFSPLDNYHNIKRQASPYSDYSTMWENRDIYHLPKTA